MFFFSFFRHHSCRITSRFFHRQYYYHLIFGIIIFLHRLKCRIHYFQALIIHRQNNQMIYVFPRRNRQSVRCARNFSNFSYPIYFSVFFYFFICGTQMQRQINGFCQPINIKNYYKNGHKIWPHKR